MEVVGIVAEYNPFHGGHRWQIAEIRKKLGDCAVVCCMSGNWVQRGECAVTDKWTRAKMALEGGADLVLDLPTPWAVSSAEAFARGAVSALTAAGITTLCFSSELGDLVPLQRAAAVLDGADFPAALRAQLETGLPFPVARQRAVEGLLGGNADFLSQPNNILAIEYLRALPPNITPLTLQRQGAGHDDHTPGDFPSASALRAVLRRENGGADSGFPGKIATMNRCERAILAKLRGMTAADFLEIPDCDRELAGRLVTAAAGATSLETLYDLAKTKRYTHARVRRAVLWAYLGLTAADRPEAVPYLRVLGMDETGQALLKGLKKTCPLPLITKPAQYRKLLAMEGNCTDLFGLCFADILPAGREFTENPVVWQKASPR
ncbi:MAG: nucleotidyltransferase family protein [Oscillospiraceae bacterium]